jgi:hypothetical protein
MSLASVLTAIGDKLRNILGVTTKYKLADMPAAIESVYGKGRSDGNADGQEMGYDKGLSEGISQGIEQGKQAEYDRFWDEYQQSGKRSSYSYGFAGTAWTDATLNPKYPIGTGSELSINYCFNYAQNITKTPLIKSVAWANYNNTFTQCLKLQEVYIEGTIGRSISFQHSNIDVPSMKRIITALADYSTSNTHTYSVSFKTECWNALEADSKAPDGGTWKDYVLSLGWNT